MDQNTTPDGVTKSEGQQTRDTLEANIRAIEEQIEAFNSHWLNHKHLVSAFGVVIMALIFIGMLATSIEIYMWGLCGVLVVVLVGVMWWRGQLANRLNVEMDAAQKAYKEYLRGRRKKN